MLWAIFVSVTQASIGIADFGTTVGHARTPGRELQSFGAMRSEADDKYWVLAVGAGRRNWPYMRLP